MIMTVLLLLTINRHQRSITDDEGDGATGQRLIGLIADEF